MNKVLCLLLDHGLGVGELPALEVTAFDLSAGLMIFDLRDVSGWNSLVMPSRYVEAAKIVNEGVKIREDRRCTMDDDADYLPGLLLHMGIRAGVQRDARNNALIVIETNFFNQHQGQIETFFRLVEQRGEYSYFRERVRGSEDTQ